MSKKNWLNGNSSHSDLPENCEDTSLDQAEIITGVVRERCSVVSYNPFTNVIVYERAGKLIQTNAVADYDGSGFIFVE